MIGDNQTLKKKLVLFYKIVYGRLIHTVVLTDRRVFSQLDKNKWNDY